MTTDGTVLMIVKSSGITKAEAKRIEQRTGHVVVFVNSTDDMRLATNELMPIERIMYESAKEVLLGRYSPSYDKWSARMNYRIRCWLNNNERPKPYDG